MAHSYFCENYRQCRIESVHFPLNATFPLLQISQFPSAPTLRQSGSDADAIVIVESSIQTTNIFLQYLFIFEIISNFIKFAFINKLLLKAISKVKIYWIRLQRNQEKYLICTCPQHTVIIISHLIYLKTFFYFKFNI